MQVMGIKKGYICKESTSPRGYSGVLKSSLHTGTELLSIILHLRRICCPFTFPRILNSYLPRWYIYIPAFFRLCNNYKVPPRRFQYTRPRRGVIQSLSIIITAWWTWNITQFKAFYNRISSFIFIKKNSRNLISLSHRHHPVIWIKHKVFK